MMEGKGRTGAMHEILEFGVYGAGGFGREVAWSMSHANARFEAICFVDDGVASGNAIDGLPVFGLDDLLVGYPELPLTVAVAAGRVRREMVREATRRGRSFVTLVHPSVPISPTVSIGYGSIVCANCVPTVGIAIGVHVHVNLGCTIGHDVVIGDYVTIGPGVHVSGNVEIGDDVFLGTGATIINGRAGAPIRIGAGCVIGAGACVTADTEPGTLYVGVPARSVSTRPC